MGERKKAGTKLAPIRKLVSKSFKQYVDANRNTPQPLQQNSPKKTKIIMLLKEKNFTHSLTHSEEWF